MKETILKRLMLYFLIFFSFTPVVPAQPKEIARTKEMQNFNLAFINSITSEGDLVKKGPKLFITVNETFTSLQNRNTEVSEQELKAFSLMLHHLTMASRMENSLVLNKVKDIWTSFFKVSQRWQVKFKPIPEQLKLLGILKNTMSAEKYTDFLEKYRDAIPIEIWSWFEPNFLSQPCELYSNIGLTTQSISCFENLLIYFQKYEKDKVGKFSYLYSKLTSLYFRLGRSEKLLELSRNYVGPNADFQKQNILIFKDAILSDYAATDKRLEYLSRLATSGNAEAGLSNLVKGMKLINQFNQDPRPPVLMEFKKWADSLDPQSQAIWGIRALTVEFFARLGNWEMAYNISKEAKNLADLSFVRVNSIYCLSEYYYRTTIEKDCSDFIKLFNKGTVPPNRLNWSYLKFHYLFVILEKKLTLRLRKEIKVYLKTPEIIKVEKIDAVVKAIGELYLKV